MREIPLNCKKFPELVTLVDDEDYEAIRAAGCVSAAGYKKGHPRYAEIHLRGGGGKMYLHNFICQLHGLPKSPDHINRNGFDNQKGNFLTDPTVMQQAANRGLPSNNTSGFKGVNWHRRSGRWEARIKASGKRKFLGLFDTPAEAARVYDKAAVEEFDSDQTYLNFPDEFTPPVAAMIRT